MSARLSGLKILIADDTKMMRDIVRTVLQSLGIVHVETASNGAEALVRLQSFQADIAFIDWEMAPTTGLEFLRQLRHDPRSPNPTLPVIMLTSHAESERVLLARQAGVSEYLIKPVTGRAIAQRIAAVINNDRPFVRLGDYFGPVREPSRRSAGEARNV